ncbi:MAG: ABC transporter permease [Oscillospiraceae bacterium]|nr:ABC transporter permease [Oscillospiraceae bacterium]
MFSILQVAVSEGLLWSLMAVGVFYTFRILNMPDLSVEGTLILGAGLAARLIANGGNPFVATLLAICIGAAGGFVTGILHTKLKIPSILAGILTMVGSYSVALRVMSQPNIPLNRWRTFSVFAAFENLLGSLGIAVSYDTIVIIFSVIVAIAIGVLLYCFAGTEIGSAMRASGNNLQMVKAQGVNTNAMIVLCLMISNGLVGLSGALIAQYQGFAVVTMGAGTIVAGLAAVVIAEVLFKFRSFWGRLISIALGSIIYRLVIALVLELGMNPNDLRLLTAITVAVALVLPQTRDWLKRLFGKVRGGAS